MGRTPAIRLSLVIILAALTVSSAFAGLGAAVPAPRSPATQHVPTLGGAPAPWPTPVGASHDSVALSAAAQRILELTQSLHHDGVPLGAIHLPNLAAESTYRTGIVSSLYSGAPAPMGVADLGVHNVSGVLRGYTMYTSSAMGQITLNNASSTYIDGDGADMFGIQLNSVLDNVSISGNSSYQFWTQNFVSYTPSSGWLVFGDNVWNFSSRSGYFPSNSLYSYGANGTLADSIVYYAAGPSFTIHYPFTVTFYNNATLIGGRSSLFFNYTVSNATLSHSGSFDFVTFNSNLTRLGGPARTPAFQVKGSAYDPIGLVNDIELDVVGNDDGDTTVFTAVNATLSIASWSSTSGSYLPVPSAFNSGTDTGETSTGLAVFWDGSTPVARMLPGPSFLTGLWNVSGTSGEREIQLSVTPANAFVFVSPGTIFNASLAQWSPSTTSPMNLYVPNAGTFDLVAELSSFDPANDTINGTANSTTAFVIALTSDPSRGIYTPLYAWDNAELASLSTSGTGASGSPYVLENYQRGSLNPEFAAWNDFEFPVFSGVQLVHTTDSVTITPPSFEINYPSWMQPELLSNGQPLTNNLQLLFFNVTNVTVRGASGITGWLSAFVAGFPEGSVLFWNSSDNLVASNNFDDEGGALVFYGGTGNTVWDNWFLPASANATDPSYVYNSGANETGLNLSENGDLVYDNAFLTPIDAVTPTLDALSCQISCQPAVYSDTWNISDQPAADWTYLHGVNLTGSIVSTTYQGGNYWWNYGSLSDPYNALPYNDTGGITVGGDYVPLTFASLYTVTFRETGLASGTHWSLTSEGVVRSTISTSIRLESPDGTYPYSVGAVVGYTAPSPKSFTVAGANLTVALTFRLDYAVTFAATGLSVSQNWSVTTSSATHSVAGGSAAGTSTIVLDLDNGSYNFTVGAVAGFTPSPLSGSFEVDGQSVSESIAFTVNINSTYAVTFTETGLASGTSWAVGLGTQQWNSTGPTLTVDEVNGSYPFAILPVPGYHSTPSGALEVTVAGASVGESVMFSPIVSTTPTYPVTFAEVGLVPGTNWSVNSSAGIKTSATSDLVVDLPNGVYTFLVSAQPSASTESYVTSSPIVLVAVDGAAPLIQSIVFTPVGHVEGFAIGLPPTTGWAWVLHGANGSAALSGNGTVNLPDGSYTFAVSAAGFAASPASGTLSVTGFGTSFLNVSFTAVSPPSPAATSSSPSLTPYVIAIAVLAGAAVFLLIGLLAYRQRANAKPLPPAEPYRGMDGSGGTPGPGVPPPKAK